MRWRRLLLIALPCIVGVSLLVGGKLLMDTPTSREDGTRESATAGTSEESGQTDKLDVCSQLTREEVEAALGKPVAEPVPGPALTSRRAGTITSSCMFSSGEGFVSLDIKRQDPTSTTIWNAAKAYQEFKDLIKAHATESSGVLEEVSGIGMNAFAETKEETANYKTTELRVLSQHSILTLRVVGSSATSTLEAAKTLAGKAITRLERYEMTEIVPAPGATPSAPEPAANLGADGRSRAPEKSQAERKNTKDDKPSPAAQRVTNATSAKVGNSTARRTAESSSTERQRPVQKSAKQTRTKKVITKRSSPRRRP